MVLLFLGGDKFIRKIVFFLWKQLFLVNCFPNSFYERVSVNFLRGCDSELCLYSSVKGCRNLASFKWLRPSMTFTISGDLQHTCHILNESTECIFSLNSGKFRDFLWHSNFFYNKFSDIQRTYPPFCRSLSYRKTHFLL